MGDLRLPESGSFAETLTGGGWWVYHSQKGPAAYGIETPFQAAHTHVSSRLQHPIYSWCLFGQLPAGDSLGLFNTFLATRNTGFSP